MLSSPETVSSEKGSTPLTSCLCVLVAGGTGGHVIPAQVLAQELTRRGYSVVFLTDARGSSYLSKGGGFPVYEMPLTGQTLGRSSGYAKRMIARLQWGYGVLKSVWYAHHVIRKVHPRLIVGFGGFPSFPVVICGVFQRIPLIFHEQNAVLGRVNRWFGPWASVIATSTPSLGLASSSLKSKVRFTGLPIRPFSWGENSDLDSVLSNRTSPNKKRDPRQEALLQDSLKAYDPPKAYGSSPIRLTIIGGSQASAIFSDVVPRSLALMPLDLQKRLHVYHQCRVEDLQKTEEFYRSLPVKKVLDPFFPNMMKIFSESHLVIARAGASTIAELTALKRPAILVPYPAATDDHQSMNAELLVRTGGGWCLPQARLTPETLAFFFQELLTGEGPQCLLFASECLGLASHRQRNSAEKLADLVIQGAYS